jgi:hypothetical protein
LFAGFLRRRRPGLRPAISASFRPFRLGSGQRSAVLARSPAWPIHASAGRPPSSRSFVTRTPVASERIPAARPQQLPRCDTDRRLAEPAGFQGRARARRRRGSATLKTVKPSELRRGGLIAFLAAMVDAAQEAYIAPHHCQLAPSTRAR